MSGLIRFNIKKSYSVIQTSVRYASTQYVPGLKGYAPGFEAPEGTREETKVIPKRRDIGHSLPSHLEGKKAQQQTNSPKKQYREALRKQRHQYAHELLEKYGQKQVKSAEKLAIAEKQAQEVKESLQQAKQEHLEHEKEVAELLHLKSEDEEKSDRNERRQQNRLAFEQLQEEKRRKQLLKLYSQTENFVTLDNLDATIDAVMSSEGRSFHDSFNDLMHNTNNVQNEIEQRKAQIKEVMSI